MIKNIGFARMSGRDPVFITVVGIRRTYVFPPYSRILGSLNAWIVVGFDSVYVFGRPAVKSISFKVSKFGVPDVYLQEDTILRVSAPAIDRIVQQTAAHNRQSIGAECPDCAAIEPVTDSAVLTVLRASAPRGIWDFQARGLAPWTDADSEQLIATQLGQAQPTWVNCPKVVRGKTVQPDCSNGCFGGSSSGCFSYPEFIPISGGWGPCQYSSYSSGVCNAFARRPWKRKKWSYHLSNKAYCDGQAEIASHMSDPNQGREYWSGYCVSTFSVGYQKKYYNLCESAGFQSLNIKLGFCEARFG